MSSPMPNQHLGLEQHPTISIYEVGGSVRDALLGVPAKDRDWVVVGATPEQMLALGFKQVGADFPVFLHPVNHEEYALARTERKQGKGYLGFSVTSTPMVTLEQDLARRDLTVNAMARSLGGVLIDPFGGVQDLTNRHLRHVTSAFAEDPLRVLRLARFYARFASLGFEVNDETLLLCQELVVKEELQELSPERIWVESERGLMEEQGGQYAYLVQKVGAQPLIFPDTTCAHHSTFPLLTLMCQWQGEITLRLAAWIGDVLPDQEPVAPLITRMGRYMRMPGRIQKELVWLLESLPHALFVSRHAPEKLLPVLNGLKGGLQQPRSSQLLSLCALHSEVFGWPNPTVGIKKAMKIWQSVKPQAIMADGYKGADIGMALGRQRLAKLRQQWPELW
ncbi:hypothetical protein [Magnetococcus sp. PR-3]|uniref:hypothetical protein n=1 Tax=Magnetococcus sp. PR-3 TaxID=3120355 RepID=UPI002FCE1008